MPFRKLKIVIYKYSALILMVIVTIISDLMLMGSALIYGELVNYIASGNSFYSMKSSIIFTLLYTFVFIFIRFISEYLQGRYCSKSAFYIRKNYVKRLFETKLSNIIIHDSSKYINNLTNDVDTLTDTYALNIAEFFSCAFCTIMSFIASYFLSWKLAIMMLASTMFMAILPLIIKRKLDNALVDVSVKNMEFIRVLKENLFGISVIKNMGSEKANEYEIEKASDNLMKSTNHKVFINSIASGLGNAIRSISMVLLIVFTCYFVYIGEVKIGAVLSIYAIGTSFYNGILGCSWVVTSIASMDGTSELIENVLNLSLPSKEEKINFNRCISLKNVTFKYPDSNRIALNSISLDFKKNKKYLIVGESGGGKSTVLKLICGFYNPNDGDIYIDETNYNTLDEHQINSLISYSQQDSYLFNRTLKDNIDFCKTGNMERLNDCIVLSDLENFIDKLPEGIFTCIDQEVNQVSGGEKLRIGLARTLYKDANLLLLDEVTSALDKRSSEVIESNILSLDNRTIINVCHKFNQNNLNKYDKIYVIEGGRLVVEGNYSEIHNNKIFKKYKNNDLNFETEKVME